MAVTFEEIRGKAAKMEAKRGNLADRVDDFLDRARINADDTVYTEKAAPVAEWDRIALDSLGSLLAFADDADAKTQAWFRRAGVTW